MPSWLCKIWRVVANLLGKIVDFIVEVLDSLVNLAVRAIKGVADAVFGDDNWLWLGAAVLAVWFFWPSKKKSGESEADYPDRYSATPFTIPTPEPLTYER